MLTRFEIRLKCEKNFANRNMGSLFHGVIMELIPTEYAEKLHQNSLKPFSQYLIPYEEEICWIINCFEDECAEYFRKGLMNGIENIEIRDRNVLLEIISSNMKKVSYKSILDSTYFAEPVHTFKIFFNSPTSFKMNNRYIIYPDIEAIYKNLMRKFDEFSKECSVTDEDTIESLVKNTTIISYNLRSTVYHLESVKIPSYIGRITVKVTGSSQLSNLARMLFKFGEYFGVGIKTALGMGAVKIEEENYFEKR